MTGRVRIHEAGPRDGLQNKPPLLASAEGVRLANAFGQVIAKNIEAIRLVSPKRMPRTADAAGVTADADIRRKRSKRQAAWTPGSDGAERGMASEGLGRRRVERSTAEGMERPRPTPDSARAAAAPVRGHVPCIVDGPRAGLTETRAIPEFGARLPEPCCRNMSIRVSMRAGTPDGVMRLLEALRALLLPKRPTRRFPNAGDRTVANAAPFPEREAPPFDSSVGERGGRARASDAKSNVLMRRPARRPDRQEHAAGLDVEQSQEAERLAERPGATQRSGSPTHARTERCAG